MTDFKFMVNPSSKRTEDLPIYKDTFQLINLTISCVLQSPKVVQETFGKLILINEAKLLQLIIKANKDKQNRKEHLNRYLSILEDTQAYFEIFISSSKLAQENIVRFHTLLEQLGKQAGGWNKSTV